VIKKIRSYFIKPVHLAPLAVFRMAFGILMLTSVLRFLAKGWVYDMYIRPKVFFPYYGFEWIKPLDSTSMYVVFGILALVSLLIALGLFYKISAILFFTLFTYVELIDKTNYLNHYYFISIAAFILIFLPANRYFSLDALRNKSLAATHAPNYFILSIKFQVFIVYFFAGLAKINSDWLLHAQPLRIWLPAHSEMPVIGSFLTKEWVAYFFSWFGCIYDLTTPFLLFIPRFVKPAYVLVIVFHLATSLFFNIGMFPYIMIALTTIFFTEHFHKRIIDWLRNLFKKAHTEESPMTYSPKQNTLKVLAVLFMIHFTIQVLVPFRYLLYDGNLYWTEQGYRFSWRVMLMEKAGTAFFYVREKRTGKEMEVSNCDYLTPMQEKMMATQPDMMINYAHFLKEEFQNRGIQDPEILVESYVTLNGKASRLIVDKSVDLSKEKDNLKPKKWIIPIE
jgi:hypothetical protein